jgi:(1->4)-alpha-D-glucan 1-alpha-D-glucosylmutase
VEVGRATSLTQSTLLLTCPGIPDIYQGTEIWDNSLVDPDNRRPVDFARLFAGLEATRDWGASLLDDGAAHDLAKAWLTARLVHHRAERPELYDSGAYEELPTHGARAGHLIAFRRDGLAVLAGRHLHRLGGDWADTRVEMPGGRWRPVVGIGDTQEGPGEHRVAEIVGRGPVAVLERLHS